MAMMKVFIGLILYTVRRIVVSIINLGLYSRFLRVSIATFNIKSFLKKGGVVLSCDKSKNLFLVCEGGRAHYFHNLRRGISLYEGGVVGRAKILTNSYGIDKIKFTKGDIVIDCGANYGDLWLGLRGQIDDRDYISFEPGVGEHMCLRLNAPLGVHHRKALGNLNGSFQFYVSEESADSSLIEPRSFSHTIDVECVRLDDYLSKAGIQRIKLFKLEAEGFEPEVLEGAVSALNFIDYVAVDGGYERGVSADETFTTINQILTQRGFILIYINFDFKRALYMRTKACF